jgi:hypothetical protein
MWPIKRKLNEEKSKNMLVWTTSTHDSWMRMGGKFSNVVLEEREKERE